MATLAEFFRMGTKCYHPFQSTRGSSSPTRVAPPSLQEICKSTIVGVVTVRRAAAVALLPLALRRQLALFATHDFEELETAPFRDSLHPLAFYHRALAYKVRCRVDGQVYLVAHGATPHDIFTNQQYPQRKRHAWLNARHAHLMAIHATCLDDVTGNVFYVMDMPRTSLEYVQVFFLKNSKPVPEIEIWEVIYQLGSAFSYIYSLGLQYGSFGLENIFVINNKIVIENELTRKSWNYLSMNRSRAHACTDDMCECCGKRRSSASDVDDSEAMTVKNLGQVVGRLISACSLGSFLGFGSHGTSPLTKTFCKQNSTATSLAPLKNERISMYTSELWHFLLSCQHPDLCERPSLGDVESLAIEMVTVFRRRGDSNHMLGQTGLLKLAFEAL